MGRRSVEDFSEYAAATRAQLRRTAYLMCGDWERASDIAQEALIRLYVAWPRLDKASGIGAYARQTVVNIAIDGARKKATHERPEELPDRPVVDDVFAIVTERLVVMQALAQLPLQQRACVVLRYYEDLSVGEVAGALRCREGTVKSQTARGLAKLRSAFERFGLDLTEADTESKEATR